MRSLSSELVAIDRAQSLAARTVRAAVDVLQPEDSCRPTGLRNPVATRATGIACERGRQSYFGRFGLASGIDYSAWQGRAPCKLPLPRDVGEAIADYLRNARPPVTHRNVFLRDRAPITSFHGSQAIAYVVRQGLARAGIDSPRKGAHQFRHTLASEMLRQGASLSEIGELLRHRSPQTTTIYAKVDLVSLRALALPWPESAR